uniref:Uncharacterized protein n=1 Tax=Tanacetum cinerariifolium TaxID=118510 RepID=A0A6L2L0R7_TANCI|nr:hypothetical protein [Tanacetum cinerariifolium]
MALAFADTHNMIAYLTKSDASEGFNQIIDFLNASSIHSSMALAVICLATGRKFNFSKYIFDSLQAADAVDDVVADSVPTTDVADDVPAADAQPTPPLPPPTTTPPPT